MPFCEQTVGLAFYSRALRLIVWVSHVFSSLPGSRLEALDVGLAIAVAIGCCLGCAENDKISLLAYYRESVVDGVPRGACTIRK